MEAHQLSTKAARVHFDWRNTDEIFDKLHEELEELRAAMKQQDAAHTREELGDVLFVVVNLARHLRVEPETALKAASRKFRQRFRHIEQTLQQNGRSFDEVTIEEMEAIWQAAKTSGI
jgi:uncharacterized protein YabN with tetrapyrrole methylase and pyrophosphatase domain